jgi:hypothetical protein
VVIVDPKGSPALADAVRAHDGQVWTLDGRLPAELLDPRPWQVPTCWSRQKILRLTRTPRSSAESQQRHANSGRTPFDCLR